MILESILETSLILFFLGLMLIIYLLHLKKKKSRQKYLENGKFITNYFKQNKPLYDIEYLSQKAKPINRMNEDVFMAKTFLLYLSRLKVLKVNYSDIYWAYGEVSKKGKTLEAVVLKTLNGTHRLYVKKQQPYIVYLYNLGIICGYSDEIKVKANQQKLKMKELRK